MGKERLVPLPGVVASRGMNSIKRISRPVSRARRPNGTNLLLGEATDGDGVDLDRSNRHTGRRSTLRGLFRIRGGAGDLFELLRVEGIETDVETAKTSGVEVRGLLAEEDAVGCEADVLRCWGIAAILASVFVVPFAGEDSPVRRISSKVAATETKRSNS